MQYRIQSENTGKTQRFAAAAAAAKTAGTARQTSSRGAWSTAGATVSVQPSFQEFLTQQTSLQTARTAADRAETGVVAQASLTAQNKGETVHTLQKGETIWGLAREQYQVDPQDILRLNKIANPNALQVGQQLRIPAQEQSGVAAISEEVVAGWYGQFHQGKLMANGKRFDMHAATIAHRDMPIGAKVELENPETGEKVRAVVTDRGPYHQGRDVDLSYGLAKRLSIAEQGVGKLKMRTL